MHAQLQSETEDLFPELLPVKPFGLTFSPVEFVGPYAIEKRELGFFRLVSSSGRIIANIPERIPLATLRVLANAWDVIKTVELVQNDLQVILSNMQAGTIQTFQNEADAISRLMGVIQKIITKVVVIDFPNGGADSITKTYDLSIFEGPYEEVESGGVWVDITSSRGIGIAFISDLIPVSVRQTLLNSWDNFQTLQAIQKRFLLILSDLNSKKILGNALKDELICLVSDIIAGMELQHE